MATSLIAKPQPIAPAYNPLKFIYNSTNVNNDGFRYIFDIYEAGTATKIAEYRLLPNLSGYGEIDLSKLLQNYVSFDFDPTDTNFDPTNCYYEYDVKVGEEYVAEVNWTANLTDNGGFVKITATHSFQVGDTVNVDGGVDNPSITGVWTVTAISTTVDFTISAPWSFVDDATGNGSVRYADNRKSVTRDIITSTGNYVFNGAIPFKDYRTYVDDDYILDDSSAKFVTSLPTEFHITPSQDIWLNLMINSDNTGVLYFINDGGDILARQVNETNLLAMHQVAGDLSALSVISGTAPLVKTDTQYYDVYYSPSAVGTKHSVTYRFYIDNRCKINDYEILFMDRMGSLGSFSFQLRDKLTGTVKKEVYNQDIQGSVVSSEWTYDSYERGQRAVYSSIEEIYELNTNWMTEEMASYFTELVSSPNTWIKIDGTYYGCVVTDTGYEKERGKNRNLIRKTLRVKLSVQDRVNG